MDESLRELERATRASPADKAAQLRYARALGRAGERDRWGLELADLASDLVPEAVADLLGTDEGLRWCLAVLAARDATPLESIVLQPPASEEAIAAAEARIGFALPPLLRRIYAIADGIPGAPPDWIDAEAILRPTRSLVELRLFGEEDEPVPELEGVVVFSPQHASALRGGEDAVQVIDFEGGYLEEYAPTFDDWFLEVVVFKAIGKSVRRPEVPFEIKGLDDAFPDARIAPGELNGFGLDKPKVLTPRQRRRALRLGPAGAGDGEALEGSPVDFDRFATELGRILESRGYSRVEPLPPTHPISLRAAWKRSSLGGVDAIALVPFVAATSGDPVDVVRRAGAAVGPAFGRWRLLVGLRLEVVLVGHGAFSRDVQEKLLRPYAVPSVVGVNLVDLDSGRLAFTPQGDSLALALGEAVARCV